MRKMSIHEIFAAIFSTSFLSLLLLHTASLSATTQHKQSATYPVLNALVCKNCRETGLNWKQCPSAFLTCHASAELAAAASVDEPRMVMRSWL